MIVHFNFTVQEVYQGFWYKQTSHVSRNGTINPMSYKSSRECGDRSIKIALKRLLNNMF